MFQRARANALVFILTSLAVFGLFSASGAAERGVHITQMPEKLRVEINGEFFTEYVFQGAPHVYLYPVIGPGGVPMTRNAPMKKVEGEDQDHPHHRSLWYSHGEVNGIDFWGESAKSGKIVHDKFLEVKSGDEVGVIRAQNNWVAPDGAVTCVEEQTIRIYNRPKNERLFDFEVTLKAGDKDVVFGDTKEGSMGIRLAESMRLNPNKVNGGKPTGHIVMSTGVRDDEPVPRGVDNKTWGKRAPWCDYYGPVEGKIVGVAIFDHPNNPRHPTSWHVRQYGLFAANPFGLHDFEKKEKGAGDLTIPAGKSVTFRYRFYLHEGDEKQAKVVERYDQYKWTDRIHDAVRPAPSKDSPVPQPKEKNK